MSARNENRWQWIWPHVGATPISQGLDTEVFDQVHYPYSETFVREAIQNSLDARLNPSRPVHVNFTFYEDGIGARSAFFHDIEANRKKAGLPMPRDWTTGRARWLVVEDFYSKGLGGSLTSRVSDFWNYWLNFGLSNKDGTGRGGRGIGRVTFLIASQVQSVIGYTRRASDGITAACGMSVLRAQEDGDEFLSTHAYLARQEQGSIYDLYNTDVFHKAVCDAFGFDGYNGEYNSGLALAIPYPHDELTPEGILAAAIENFAPAIMNGMLVLGVNGRRLDSDSIISIAPDVAHRMNDEAVKSDVSRYLTLIAKACDEKEQVSISAPNAMKGDLAALHESDLIKKLQESTDEGNSIVLKITFPLERHNKTQDVSLTAVLAKTPVNVRPIDRLFREGMSLPDVRASNPGELDLVILVEDETLATYLNFCEGKAHLDLLESKGIPEKLAENGFAGVRVKRLVKALPVELRKLLIPEVSEPDSNVFDSFFSIPSDKPGKTSRRKDAPEPDDPGPVDPPPPRIPIFKVDTLPDGLRVRANPDFNDWPVNLTMTVAYADGSRRPAWSEHDFRLDDLALTHDGCELEHAKNKLKAMNCGPDCFIEITGFDANRELDTQIRPWRHAQEN
jgi:hypothetical protein